ncbi:MAG TPA: hypothetical protein DDY21_00270 [Candidatus Moranbacteria bacterium]|nr:hypothetical protein [Candidatus Moranbacteria bacterium]
MKGLVSIIVPNRKGEKNETLRSIKEQTYKNIEVIEIIDKKGKGASWARNKGAKKAKGEYLFFCDNDIELEFDCLENLVETLEKNDDCDWAFGRFIIDGVEYNLNKKGVPKNKYDKKFIDYFYGISTMSLIRAKAKPKFDEELKRFVDWDLWIRLTRAGHKPAFCDKILFSTSYKNGGISSGLDYNNAKARIYEKNLTKIADIVIPHHSQHAMLADVLGRLDNKIFNIIIHSGGTFSHNCNEGAKLAKTDNIIFLNDDTEPTNELMIKMIEDDNDITGIAQYIPSQKRTKYGIGIDADTFHRFLADSLDEVIIPSGFCFKFRKKCWDELGGLDEVFKNGSEDIDIFLRAREKGIKFGYLQESIKHFLSKSEGRFDFAGNNDIILENRWKEKIFKELGDKSKKQANNFLNKNNMKALCKSSFKLRGRVIQKGETLELEPETFKSALLAGVIEEVKEVEIKVENKVKDVDKKKVDKVVKQDIDNAPKDRMMKPRKRRK